MLAPMSNGCCWGRSLLLMRSQPTPCCAVALVEPCNVWRSLRTAATWRLARLVVHASVLSLTNERLQAANQSDGKPAVLVWDLSSGLRVAEVRRDPCFVVLILVACSWTDTLPALWLWRFLRTASALLPAQTSQKLRCGSGTGAPRYCAGVCALSSHVQVMTGNSKLPVEETASKTRFAAMVHPALTLVVLAVQRIPWPSPLMARTL